MWTKGLWTVCLSLALFGFLGVLRAGEAAKEGGAAKEQPAKPETKEDKEAPKAAETKAPPVAKEDIVAKVDDDIISWPNLEAARRFFEMNAQVRVSGKQALDQVINRILWSRHFAKQSLQATEAEVRQVVAQIDRDLKGKGSSYQQELAARGLRPEAHIPLLAYDVSMQKVVNKLKSDIKADEIKKEFDAHPDHYNASKVKLSQIFLDTTGVGNDPKEMEKAKQEIDDIYKKVSEGGNFDRLAAFYSTGQAAGMPGDRGWFMRKGSDIEEKLIEAAWILKEGEFTKPVLGARGWSILKVTERENAALTPDGAKPRVLDTLTRKKLESVLDELKGKATIEIFM